MPFYISEFEGLGTDENPFIPYTGVTPRSNFDFIDLRPDGGATLGGNGLNACLLFMTDTVNGDSKLLKFGAGKSEIVSVATKNNIISRLGLNSGFFELNSVIDVVSELLLKPPENAWKPIRPTARGRTLNIHLGGRTSIPESSMQLIQIIENAKILVGFLGAAFGFPLATIITEDFNGADQSPMTGHDLSWTQFNTAGEIDIVSNQVSDPATGTQAYARADSDLDSDDHYAQIDAIQVSTLADGSGVITRKAGGDTATTLYRYRANQGSSPTEKPIMEKKIDDSTTTLGNGSTEIVSGDVIRGEADGSDITMLINSSIVIGPVTDTGVTGNVRAGLFLFTSSGPDFIGDDFEAGDLAVRRRSVLF